MQSQSMNFEDQLRDLVRVIVREEVAEILTSMGAAFQSAMEGGADPPVRRTRKTSSVRTSGEPKTRVSRASPERQSIRSGILSILRSAEGPIGSRAIANSLSKDNKSAIFQAAMRSLLAEKLVSKQGERKTCVYEITTRGQKHDGE